MPRPCQDVQRFFRDVPAGTTLEISIDGPAGSCSVAWALIGPGPDPNGVMACPAQVETPPLSVPNATYVVVYDMSFLANAAVLGAMLNADATVTIGLRVAGRSPVRCTVSGQAGDHPKWLWPVLTA